MILINGKEYRNLEEQVLKNQQDIARHYDIDRVLADFGIFVVGNLPSAEDLVGKVGEAYGEAYGIGTAPPYTFYVWTRANPDIGENEPYWFNIGQLAIEGPEGPQGPQGNVGATGQRGATIWTFSAATGNAPNNSAFPGLLVGDYALNLQNGEYWKYINGVTWSLLGLLRGTQGIQGPEGPRGPAGPQGPQGIQGPQGAPGKFIHIVGTVANVDQLIPPADLNDLSIAYLVGTVAPYDLYVQVGETPATAQWMNQGHLNSGTMVTVNGVVQESWDADTKLDDVSKTGETLPTALCLYGTALNKSRKMYGLYGTPVSGRDGIPYLNTLGGLNVLTSSILSGNSVTNKEYVDNKVSEAAADVEVIAAPLYEHNIRLLCYKDDQGAYFRTSIFTTSETPLTAAEVIAYLYNNRSQKAQDLNEVPGSYEAHIESVDSSGNVLDVTPCIAIEVSETTLLIATTTDEITGAYAGFTMDISEAETYPIDILDVVNLIAQVDSSSSSGGKLYRHVVILSITISTSDTSSVTAEFSYEGYRSTNTPFALNDILYTQGNIGGAPYIVGTVAQSEQLVPAVLGMLKFDEEITAFIVTIQGIVFTDTLTDNYTITDNVSEV